MKSTAGERNGDALMTKAEKKRRRTVFSKRKVTCLVFFMLCSSWTLAQYEEKFTSLNAAGQARTNYEKSSKYAAEKKILELYSAQEGG